MSAPSKLRPAAKLVLGVLFAATVILLALTFFVPAKLQVSTAALADASCYASLSDGAQNFFLPLYAGGRLWRIKESRFRREWMLDDLSVLQVATVAYGDWPIPMSGRL